MTISTVYQILSSVKGDYQQVVALAWLRALADADTRPVPTLHSSSVDRLNGPGASI